MAKRRRSPPLRPAGDQFSLPHSAEAIAAQVQARQEARARATALRSEFDDQLQGILESPGSGIRVSKTLADGGRGGRWLVIYGNGLQEPKLYAKGVARQVIKARRRVARGSNPWMLNVDRLDFGTKFDDVGQRFFVHPWMQRSRNCFVCFTSKGTDVTRQLGPYNLLQAYPIWFALQDARDIAAVNGVKILFILDVSMGEILAPNPRRWSRASRENPTGVPYSGRRVVTDAGGDPQDVVMVRPVVRKSDGSISRPRVYVSAEVAQGASRVRDQVAAGARARGTGSASSGEVVPFKRR